MTKARLESIISGAIKEGRKPMAETKADKLFDFFMEENRFCFVFENKRGEKYTEDFSIFDIIGHCGGILKYFKRRNPNNHSLCENTVIVNCFEDGKPERKIFSYEHPEFHGMKLSLLNREEILRYLFQNIKQEDGK